MVKVATLATMLTKLEIYTYIILIATAQEHLRKRIQSEISDLLTRFYHEWERTTSSVFPKKRQVEGFVCKVVI